MALIQSKRDGFMASLDVINPSEQMETTSKWKKLLLSTQFCQGMNGLQG